MTKTVSMLWALTLLASAIHAGQARQELKLTLRQEVVVHPLSVVTVRDIAAVRGPRDLAAKAERVSLTTAPTPGKEKVVDADYVKLMVTASGIGASIRMCGCSHVRLVGKCQQWSSEAIARTACEYVESVLPKGSRTYELHIERPPRAIITGPGSSSELRARLLGRTVRNGVNTVLVEAVIDGRVAATSSAAIRVTEVAEVLTAAEPIRQGQPLTYENTNWVRQDVSRISQPVRISDVHQGLVARRSIPAGAVITSADVCSPPAVKKGDLLSIVVKCGAIKLITSGEARQDGRCGETIAVRPVVCSQDVRGTLIEPGLVEIAK